jgi:hypothetical protein
MPPAAMGALFEKTAPLDPPQKLLIVFLKKPNKSFLGVQGAIFQKSPLAAGGKKIKL